MNKNEIFTVAEFADFSRTTRDTLLHYDRIGLLSPQLRGDNNYRYYSNDQLAVVNLIRTCQALGMTLAEIKGIKDNRTPEIVNEILDKQMVRIDQKIAEWVSARKLLDAFKNMINSTLDINEDSIAINHVKAQRIVLGEKNDYSKERTAYDALLSFYRDCRSKHPDLDTNYPVWGMFEEERIKRMDWVWPDRYYMYNPEGSDVKKASLYAIGYTRDGYGKSSLLYKRMLKYIRDNDFEVCGPAYEEYPQNEVCIVNESDYLMRVMITVRSK